MIAYFVRRIVGGMVTLFFAELLIYTLVIYIPPAREPACCIHHTHQAKAQALWRREIETIIDNDQPWPLSYVAWLFDPSDKSWEVMVYEDGFLMGTRDVRTNFDIALFDWRLQGSGVLTGYLGSSLIVAPGQDVVDMFGRGLGEFLLIAALALPVSMATVAVQRLRRPLVSGLSPNFPMSRNLLDQRLCPMRMLGL